MGNRVTFELGADIDASVTNAAKRFHDAMKATADMFPGMNVQAKIVGDTMRLTLTEGGKAAQKTGQHLNLMSKELRSSQLLMMEGSRVAQDFFQVIGQQGVGGAVRASANNIQRMVEIFGMMNPSFSVAKVAAISLGTAALVPLADYFFGVGKNAKQTKEEVVDLTKMLKELSDQTTRMEAGGEEKLADAALRATLKQAEAAAIDARVKLAEEQEKAEQRGAFAGLNASPQELREAAAQGKTVGEIAVAKDPQLIAARVAEMEARRQLAAIQTQAAKLQEKRNAERAARDRERVREAVKRLAEMPETIRKEAVEAATKPFGARRADLSERQNMLGIEMEEFEAAGRDAQGRGRPLSQQRKQEQASLRGRQDVLQAEDRKLRVEQAEAAKRGAAMGEIQVALLRQALTFGLRLPIVPIPNVNR